MICIAARFPGPPGTRGRRRGDHHAQCPADKEAHETERSRDKTLAVAADRCEEQEREEEHVDQAHDRAA